MAVDDGRADRGLRDPWIAAVLVTGGALGVLLVAETAAMVTGLQPAHDAYGVGAVSSLVPILWLIYGGYRVASGGLPPARYRRIAGWSLGAGIGFLALNLVIMRSVPAENAMQVVAWVRWAVSLGAGAGLLVGVFEARAVERARTAERLRVERREAKRQNDFLEEFASVVSHDLRNPLNVAMGRLELARDEVQSPHLDDVEAALDRMAGIVDETLVLAREGQMVATTEAVAVQGLAEECWEVVETRDAELVVVDDAPTIGADPARLRHVFENLFRNAVEHGGADVTIRVGCLTGADGFFVEDDGAGFGDADTDAVFEPGYSTADDDSGLGLNIVRRIAEAHGWTVEATESELGGARFEIAGVDLEGRPRANTVA